MIRVLAGSAAGVLALGLAASFVAPSLIGVPRGEPMLVAASDPSLLQEASFEPTPCRVELPEALAMDTPAARLVTLAVRPGPHGLALAIKQVPPDAALPAGTLIFALAPDGRVVGMWEAETFPARDCDVPQEAPVAGNV